MKMKWRNLPAIVTLLAGFITCVITTLCRYPLNKMLWVLIAVMTVFFTIGLIIRAVIMHLWKAEMLMKPMLQGMRKMRPQQLTKVFRMRMAVKKDSNQIINRQWVVFNG